MIKKRGNLFVLVNAKVTERTDSEGSITLKLSYTALNNEGEEEKRDTSVVFSNDFLTGIVDKLSQAGISFGSFISVVFEEKDNVNHAVDFVKFGMITYNFSYMDKENKEVHCTECLFVGPIGKIRKFNFGEGCVKISFPVNVRDKNVESTTWYTLNGWNYDGRKTADRLNAMFGVGDIGAFICSEPTENPYSTSTGDARISVDASIKFYELLHKKQSVGGAS